MTKKYIWTHEKWPDFTVNATEILPVLAECRKAQGALLQKGTDLNLEESMNVEFEAYLDDAVASAKIEGENLDRDSLRASLSQRLGMNKGGLSEKAPRVREDNFVAVLTDATMNSDQPLTHDRLKGWHAALFPSGYSAFEKVVAGEYASEQMGVYSGRIGHAVEEYLAPPPERTGKEMDMFLRWFNESRGQEDGLIRAAKAHLHFVAIHPFQDGNGRLARAITDMAIARDERSGVRLYSISSCLHKNLKGYYAALSATTGQPNMDVTPWVKFHLEAQKEAILDADKVIRRVTAKGEFWKKHATVRFNERQTKVLTKLLDGFEGNLTNKKYQRMTKASPNTALRDLDNLVQKGILKPTGAGRGSAYELAPPARAESYLETLREGRPAPKKNYARAVRDREDEE